MTYVINGHKIECCLRCQNIDLLASYPVLFCQKCSAFSSISSAGPEVVFTVREYRVRITQNKSYINDLQIDTVLPYDICSEEKLKTYLIFS